MRSDKSAGLTDACNTVTKCIFRRDTLDLITRYGPSSATRTPRLVVPNHALYQMS